jgi:hypothetical protein
MLRLVEVYTPDNAPVKVRKLTCLYQALKEGVSAHLEFDVTAATVDAEGKAHLVGTGIGGKAREAAADGIEAVEFTFVLLDIFDNLLSSFQGIAGPGRYPVGSKKHKAKWVFDFDGAFSQYHTLCFPSQARFLDGRIWRCERTECLEWLNFRLREAGLTLTVDDVFPASAAHEGVSE